MRWLYVALAVLLVSCSVDPRDCGKEEWTGLNPTFGDNSARVCYSEHASSCSAAYLVQEENGTQIAVLRVVPKTSGCSYDVTIHPTELASERHSICQTIIPQMIPDGVTGDGTVLAGGTVFKFANCTNVDDKLPINELRYY